MSELFVTTDGLEATLDHAIGSGAVGRVVHGALTREWNSWPAGTEIAVKRLHSQLRRDAAARHSLANEIEVGRAAQHRSLVRHLAAGEDQGGPYLVMEFVGGRTLRETLALSRSLPEPLVRAVAHGVAGALAALHEAGFVHADVKPDNIRLDTHGRAVLMDLGFARRVSTEGSLAERAFRSLTGSSAAGDGGANSSQELGVNPGSLAYLSPERARGSPCTPASDVFSLGVVLYEAATGVHPFASDALDSGPPLDATGFSSGKLLRRSIDDPGADRLLAAIATARFVPPSRLVPQVSPFLDAMLVDLLRRDPLERPVASAVGLRFADGERSAWWREQLDFGSQARRGALGEQDSLHLTPLVGRERELSELLALFRDAFATPPRASVVWLSGPSGSGKSRLMSDAAALARKSLQPPPLYLYGRCPAFEEQRPCMPILRLLERYLRLPPGAELGRSQREQLTKLVPPSVAHALAQALTPKFNGTTEVAVPVALAEWLVSLARSAPLIVFLDDVNFADEGSLDVLRGVAERLGETQLALVLGFREHDEVENPEQCARLRADLEQRGRWRELPLVPFDEDAVQALVEQLFHHTTPRRRIGQVLFARSRGNVGLLAEILRGLIDRGEARPFGPLESKWTLEIAPERLPLPDSLHTMIQERLQKVSSSDREWLKRMAVAGGRIELEFLARAFHAPQGEIDETLTRLVSTGWLSPIGDRYRFARPALREAVYRSIDAREKRDMHSRVADAFGPTDPEGAQEPRERRLPIGDAFQRAFHLRAADRHLDLLRVLRPLVKALLRRGQPQRVYVLARWGVDALAALAANRSRNRWRIEFLEAAADAADRLGYREEQRQWLDRLSDLEFDPERDPDALSRVYVLHGRHAASTGQYGLARGMFRNAVELALKAGDDELASEALRRLGAVQAHVGELEDARELLSRARDHAAHDPQRAVALIQLGIIDLLENHLEHALENVDRALRLQRRTRRWNLPGISAAAHMLRGRIYRVCGRPGRALGSMKRAVTLAHLAGERRLEMEATARLGGLLLDINRPAEAEARLREALLIAGEIEDRRGQTLALLWLGTLLWEQADPDAASVLDRAMRLANEMGLERAESLALAIRARIARAEGDLETALALSGRAEEILSRQGAELPDRIVVVGTRALVLSTAGQSEDAEALLKVLRGKMKSDNERIDNEPLRKAHRTATSKLLDAVLSPDGVIYPRVELDIDPD